MAASNLDNQSNTHLTSSTPLISVCSDFGVQSQGVGIMEFVAWSIAPRAKYINLMHGIPVFSVSAGARCLETVLYLPVGNHVCVVDPGVGSTRRPIVLFTGRGDHLLGPDNGVLLPAARILGGIVSCHLLENEHYMLCPVSPLFNGRDIFVPAAAHMANGVIPSNFGREVREASLAPAPYVDARPENDQIVAEVIHVNHYGSVILNITHETWKEVAPTFGGDIFVIPKSGNDIVVKHGRTYSDVAEHAAVVMVDDYSRVEVAINAGSFAKMYGVAIGDKIILRSQNIPGC